MLYGEKQVQERLSKSWVETISWNQHKWVKIILIIT